MNFESLALENSNIACLESSIKIQGDKKKFRDIESHLYDTQNKPAQISDLQGEHPKEPVASTLNCGTDILAQSEVSCQTCGKMFTCKRKLHNCKLPQHDFLAFTRRGCDESFTDENPLVVSTLTRTAEKYSRCTLYNKLFAETQTFAGHVSADENIPNVAKCKQFRKDSLNSLDGINRVSVDIAGEISNHKVDDLARRTQTIAKRYTCEVCTRSFARNSNLKRHMLTHTGEKKYKCELCDETFTQSSTLKYHVRTHAGKEEFKCEICNLSFPKSVKLMRHMFIHTGEKGYKCEICNRTFSQNCNLKNHMFIHTGEKRFQCDICCWQFTQHDSLKKHMVTHTGEKNFKCEICLQLFTVKSNLQTHMLLHAGVKRFKCEVCYRPFSQKSSLKKHMLTHAGE